MGRGIGILFSVLCCISIAWGQEAATPPAPATDNAGKTASASSSGSADTVTSTEAPWDKFTNFSALVTGGPLPGDDDEIHIYRSKNLLRMEGHDQHSYVIQNLAKANDVKVLSKAECLQMAMSFSRSYPFSLSAEGNTYKKVSLGKETVDGHSCAVEEVTITFAASKRHKDPLKIKVWEAEDLQGFPIKVQTQSHRFIEYRNVDLGPLDPTLFISPASCDRLESEKAKDAAGKKKAPVAKSQPADKSQ